MATFGKRHDPVRLLWRRLGMFGLFALVVAAVPGVWDVYGKESESRGLRTQAEIQAQHLTQQQAQLHGDISKLQTARGKEEALREQYAVGKKGEGLIIIVDPPKSQPIEATSTFRVWVHKFLPFW